jgi:hypothetical protein
MVWYGNEVGDKFPLAVGVKILRSVHYHPDSSHLPLVFYCGSLLEIYFLWTFLLALSF